MVPFNEFVTSLWCGWWHLKKQRALQCTEAGIEKLRVSLSEDVVIMPAVGLYKWKIMMGREM
jgi:hypothetical protein